MNGFSSETAVGEALRSIAVCVVDAPAARASPVGKELGRFGKVMMNVGHRGRMRDHAALLIKLLQSHRRISLARIASELGTSETTARRWVDSFSCIMPIRLERGIVIVDGKD